MTSAINTTMGPIATPVAETPSNSSKIKRVLGQGIQLVNKGFKKLCNTATSLVGRTDTQEFPKLAKCWKVVKIQDDIYGGHLITFQFKTKYRDTQKFDKALEKIFPAIEPGEGQIHFNHPGFKFLGYEYHENKNGAYVTMPDKEALEARFEQYRKDHPELNLKPFKVLASEGIATDRDYSRAYFSGNMVLLSTGLEFFHDQMAHIDPTLDGIFENTDEYYKGRDAVEKRLKILDGYLSAIEQGRKKSTITPEELPKLPVILGILTDGIWATNEFEQYTGTFFKGKKALEWGTDPNYQRYWAKRFNGEVLDMAPLTTLWRKFIQVVDPSYGCPFARPKEELVEVN